MTGKLRAHVAELFKYKSVGFEMRWKTEMDSDFCEMIQDGLDHYVKLSVIVILS